MRVLYVFEIFREDHKPPLTYLFDGLQDG